MHLIIDSNSLRSPALRHFLSAQSDNCAVLTDYAAMEAYKGDTLVTILKSMEILSEFPAQVVILKTTGVVCGIRGRDLANARNLIDENQTRGFARYCRALVAAKNGDLMVQAQLLENGRAAEEQMDRMLVDAEEMPKVFKDMERLYEADDVNRIKLGEPISPQAQKTLLESAVVMTRQMMRNHPEVRVLPDREEIPNTFIFRIALMAQLLHLKWISYGGPINVKPQKVRNDLVDINFATYATYFDGLLTADQKLNEIYERGQFVLTAITTPIDNAIEN